MIPDLYSNANLMEFLDNAIVRGYSAEIKRLAHFTSTREELLGILSIYYLLEVYLKMFGRPDNTIHVEIVVDSESANTIRKRTQEKNMNPTLSSCNLRWT